MYVDAAVLVAENEYMGTVLNGFVEMWIIKLGVNAAKSNYC